MPPGVFNHGGRLSMAIDSCWRPWKIGSMKRKNAARTLTVEQFHWECRRAAKLPLERSAPVPAGGSRDGSTSPWESEKEGCFGRGLGYDKGYYTYLL